MGLLSLKRFMSMQRERDQERRRRRTQVRNTSIASRGKRKVSRCQQDFHSKPSKFIRDGSVAGESIASQATRESSPFHQDDNSQSDNTNWYSGPTLPEDIWRHIHSLMTLRDAARAACVSHAFLCSWRCRPNLDFSVKTLGLNENVHTKDKVAKEFTSIIDQILKNHSGTGLKTFKLRFAPDYCAKCLDSWLQMAVTPGIEVLTITLRSANDKYQFPCSLISNGRVDSMRDLYLARCAFHPTIRLGCLKSLARLDLFRVRITGDELGCFLSNSFALRRLAVRYCSEIICVRIPCLQQLSYLAVFGCSKLQVIESKAPNLSSFNFAGKPHARLSLGQALEVKNLYVDCSSTFCSTRAELASSMPNTDTLGMRSCREMVYPPVTSSKFLYLQSLRIDLRGDTVYSNLDYVSLASSFNASTSLESFILNISKRLMDNLLMDNVMKRRFAGFSSFKSLVEVRLLCCILTAWLS